MKFKPKFTESFFATIDSNRFMVRVTGWLYIGMAAINALLPFYVLYNVLESRMLNFLGWGAKFAFFNIFGILLAVAIVSVLLWWARRERLSCYRGSADYPVMGLFSHLLRTFGDWLGMYYACVGFLVTLIAHLTMGGERIFFLQAVGMIGTGTGSGWQDLVFIPITGIIILLVFRLLSEFLSAFAAIAASRTK